MRAFRNAEPGNELGEEIAGHGRRLEMATKKQTAAAKRNIKKARAAASKTRTISKLPRSVRSDLGKQGARARARGGKAGHALEDRNRQQLYEEAKRLNVRGRSRMGKWELIDAIRGAR
jgi:hypothetical protein